MLHDENYERLFASPLMVEHLRGVPFAAVAPRLPPYRPAQRWSGPVGWAIALTLAVVRHRVVRQWQS